MIPVKASGSLFFGMPSKVVLFAEGVTLIADVTVNPDVNSHMLEGLKSGTLYKVQICGFTGAGVGVRSEVTAFTTDHHG